MDEKLVLVTGATGYIASRLIPRLLERGYRVRALARDPSRLAGRAWFRHVEAVSGDVTDPASLPAALSGAWTAYYLIHNMSSGRGYTARERTGAHRFADAAQSAGLEHIIYLGGLADPCQRLAAHMRSRIETGEILRAGRVPVTEFRAGVILGPGSISFEMIRFMTELLPIVPGPFWLNNESQPIAAQNVIDYLLAALENNNGHGQVFEIGGPEVMKYKDLMLGYARLRGLKRGLVTLPFMPLWFMAFGVGLMTPVPRRIAYALIDGLRSDSLVREPKAREAFPSVELIPFDEAVADALDKLHPARIEPVWTDGRRPVVSIKHEGFFINHRSLQVKAPPEDVFCVVASLGGVNGWLFANWLWRLRAWIDQLVGGGAPLPLGEGTGVRGELQNGDRLDFYRVESIGTNQLLLHSELKAPGEGWMEWSIRQIDNVTHLTQTGYFAPRGLPGFLYWYLLYPFHAFVFRGLIHAIVKKASQQLGK